MNILKGIGDLFLWILKLPNNLWPEWAKGARLTVISILITISAVGSQVDIPLISQALCFIWNLVLSGCIPVTLQGWIILFLAWVALALKIEDEQEKTAAGVPSPFNSIPKEKAA